MIKNNINKFYMSFFNLENTNDTSSNYYVCIRNIYEDRNIPILFKLKASNEIDALCKVVSMDYFTNKINIEEYINLKNLSNLEGKDLVDKLDNLYTNDCFVFFIWNEEIKDFIYINPSESCTEYLIKVAENMNIVYSKYNPDQSQYPKISLYQIIPLIYRDNLESGKQLINILGNLNCFKYEYIQYINFNEYPYTSDVEDIII